MYILKTSLFVLLMLGSLFFVTYYLMSWSLLEVIVLLLVGTGFVAGSIWGYKKMYHEDD